MDQRTLPSVTTTLVSASWQQYHHHHIRMSSGDKQQRMLAIDYWQSVRKRKREREDILQRRKRRLPKTPTSQRRQRKCCMLNAAMVVVMVQQRQINNDQSNSTEEVHWQIFMLAFRSAELTTERKMCCYCAAAEWMNALPGEQCDWVCVNWHKKQETMRTVCTLSPEERLISRSEDRLAVEWPALLCPLQQLDTQRETDTVGSCWQLADHASESANWPVHWWPMSSQSVNSSSNPFVVHFLNDYYFWALSVLLKSTPLFIAQVAPDYLGKTTLASSHECLSSSGGARRFFLLHLLRREN